MMFRCFLALWVFVSCPGASQLQKYALRTQIVTLDPGLQKPPDEILWKHNGNKVVEFDGNMEKLYNQFKGRVVLDWHSAELLISDVRYEDSGDYALEAYTGKVLRRFESKLEVVDKVAKPTISCEIINGSTSNKSGHQATLSCSAEPGQSQALMTYEWSPDRSTQTGPKLTIPLGNENDDKEYDCTVRNPLSSETATFTAKDCYPDNGSDGLIAGICIALIVAIALLLLGVLFCKQKQKACFAKTNDVEKQSPPGRTDESAQGDESRTLLDRAPTIPSQQSLGHLAKSNENHSLPDEMPPAGNVTRLRNCFERQDIAGQNKTGLEKNEDKDKTTAPPSPLGRKPSLPPELATNDYEDADVDQHGEPEEEEVTEGDPADSWKGNDVLLDDHSEDTQSDLQAATASEQPESESETKPDEDEEAISAPENGVSPPAAQPQSPLAQTSPNMALEDGEQKEDANSDQVTGETTVENNGDSDSPGLEEGNESGGLSEVKDSSTTPEQKDEETTGHEQNSKLGQNETHLDEDNQQERDKQVPEDSNESDDVGDQQEKDEAKNLPLDTSQQPQSPITSKPDSSNTFVESPDIAKTVPDQEEKDKSRHTSHSDSVTEDADKGEAGKDKNEVLSGPEKEKLDNESFGEDKEG